MAAVAVRTAARELGSSSGSSEPEPPKWAMLDRYVFTRFDLPACGSTTSPECCTSQGVPFRISLSLSAPPAVSRFYLHMRPGAADHHCRILGSHRDALLFSMFVRLPDPLDPEGEQGPSRFWKQEMFVYIAGSTAPTLTPIPPCIPSLEEEEEGDDDDDFPPDSDDEGVSDDDDADSFDILDDRYNPLSGFIQFQDQAVGVLCNGSSGDYVVAYLCVSRYISHDSVFDSGSNMVEAQMCLYYSSESKWERHGLPIIYRDDRELGDLLRWSTDRVVACGTYLCWVDYNCGILFCEVFKKHHLAVTYLRLPVKAHLFPGACMDMYRNICAVEDGGTIKLKFVDVIPSDGSVLNIWTLVMKDGIRNWKHELVIQNNELRISNLVPSPHGPLMFPLISMSDPYVAYVAVGERGFRVKKVWLVPVDLIGMSAKYAFPYLKGEDDLLGDDADMARKKAYCFEPFIPCDVNLFFPQVTGDMTALRNAPVSLPSCLEGDSYKTSMKREDPILPWASSDVQGANLRRLHSEAFIECAQTIPPQIFRPLATRFIQTKCLQQVSFRLLCPIDLVGGLIGRQGVIIKAIERKTSACIDISYLLSGCMERSPEGCSNVQLALRIFDKMVELEIDARFEKPSQFLARALVTKSQAGCLVGLGGATIKEMVNLSRARIQILDDTDVPACASRSERVIQITGELFDVKCALCLVSWILRNRAFSSEKTSYGNGCIRSSDFTESSRIRQANISSDCQVSTDIFPWNDHGTPLSYEIVQAENSFSSINLGPPEAQKLVNGGDVQIKSSVW